MIQNEVSRGVASRMQTSQKGTKKGDEINRRLPYVKETSS